MVMGVVTKPHVVVPDGLTVVCFSCSGRVIGYCSKHLTHVSDGDSFCCGIGKVPCSGCGRWVWLHMTTHMYHYFLLRPPMWEESNILHHPRYLSQGGFPPSSFLPWIALHQLPSIMLCVEVDIGKESKLWPRTVGTRAWWVACGTGIVWDTPPEVL